MLCCDLGTSGKTGNLENTFEVALFLLKKESTTFNGNNTPLFVFSTFFKKANGIKIVDKVIHHFI